MIPSGLTLSPHAWTWLVPAALVLAALAAATVVFPTAIAAAFIARTIVAGAVVIVAAPIGPAGFVLIVGCTSRRRDGHCRA